MCVCGSCYLRNGGIDMARVRSYKNRVVCPICKKDLYGEVGYVHPSTGHIVCKECYDKTTKFKVSKAMEE